MKVKMYEELQRVFKLREYFEKVLEQPSLCKAERKIVEYACMHLGLYVIEFYNNDDARDYSAAELFAIYEMGKEEE